MSPRNPKPVQRHYTRFDLADRIFDALRRAGADLDALTVDDLGPIDEFHIRGREATTELAELGALSPGTSVLDVGCGIGGPSRVLAVVYGCRVTGIDLVAEYCQVAKLLCPPRVSGPVGALRSGQRPRPAVRRWDLRRGLDPARVDEHRGQAAPLWRDVPSRQTGRSAVALRHRGGSRRPDSLSRALGSRPGDQLSDHRRAGRGRVAGGRRGGVRVWRNLAVGVGFSRFNTGSEAVVAAALPHPFFFDRERPVSGTAIAAREETAVHIQAQWVIPVSDVVEVAVFGGPTFFTVEQDLVSGINFTDIFPFETATFVSASVQQQSESAVGFHVGADIAVYFTPNVGVGGLVRFSRATVDFSSIDGGTVSADTGGVHVGGGLRLRF